MEVRSTQAAGTDTESKKKNFLFASDIMMCKSQLVIMEVSYRILTFSLVISAHL
jgi:hypothetical protein